MMSEEFEKMLEAQAQERREFLLWEFEGGIYPGSREDWMARAASAEYVLARVQTILDEMRPIQLKSAEVQSEKNN